MKGPEEIDVIQVMPGCCVYRVRAKKRHASHLQIKKKKKARGGILKLAPLLAVVAQVSFNTDARCCSVDHSHGGPDAYGQAKLKPARVYYAQKNTRSLQTV